MYCIEPLRSTTKVMSVKSAFMLELPKFASIGAGALHQIAIEGPVPVVSLQLHTVRPVLVNTKHLIGEVVRLNLRE